MTQYISKSAVVAEIERLEKINQEYKKTWKWKFKWFYRTIIGRLEVLEGLKKFINTLEVKEVDFVKEFYTFSEKHKLMDKGIEFADIEKTASFFFQLGLLASNPIIVADKLKAQKGEEV